MQSEKAIDLQKRLKIKQMLLNEYNHFYKDTEKNLQTHSSQPQMSMPSILSSSHNSKHRNKNVNLNFYKPNELIYIKQDDNEALKNDISRYNNHTNPNYSSKIVEANNNSIKGNNSLIETLPKQSVLVSSPYKDGKVNKIYSIHKIDNDTVFQSNNFFTDNVNSLNSFHTKRKTYHVKNSSESFNKVFDPSNKLANENLSTSENLNNKEMLEEREKEFLIAKLHKQQSLKNSLDMQKKKHDLYLKSNQNYLFTENIALDPGKI